MKGKIVKKVKRDFHAVEFMRKVRSELTELYQKDRQTYLESLKEAMEDFKKRQKKAQSSGQHKLKG